MEQFFRRGSIRWPDKIEPGSTTNHITHFTDIMPTLAAIANVTPPSNIDGISFLPTLIGQDSEQIQHQFLYWEHPVYSGDTISATHLRQAVRMGKWKGLRERTTGAIELYNLDIDVSEQNNIAAQNPQIVSQIRDIMDAEHDTPLLQPNVPIPHPHYY